MQKAIHSYLTRSHDSTIKSRLKERYQNHLIMIIVIITADEAVVEAFSETTSGLLIRQMPIGMAMHAMELALRRAIKMRMGRHLLSHGCQDPMQPQEIKIIVTPQPCRFKFVFRIVFW